MKVVASLPAMLNVANVVERTEAEGPGARFAVWVQGCPMRCKGCCNPDELAFVTKTLTRPEDLAARALSVEVEGVTLLGGEPFAQAEGLARFAEIVRGEGLSVMVFTGYTLDELRAMDDPKVATLLAQTDLLVDGRYERERRTTEIRWVGSSNQRMHFLTERYSPGDPRFSARNTFEVHVVDGEVIVNGWPVLGAKTGRAIAGGES